jgi:hypothetical protein
MEDCVDDRDARDAICAQPVQAETPLPRRIAVTAQQRPRQRDRQGTLVAGIPYAGSTDADGLTSVNQLHVTKPILIAAPDRNVALWVIRR